MTNLVRRGEATLGLRYFTGDAAELVSLDAGSEAMLVVAEPRHALAGRRIRDASLLARERWIGFPPSRGERDYPATSLTRQLLRSRLDGADIVVIDSLTAQKRLAQAGFGLALVPQSSVRDELRRGLLVELDVPAMRTAIPIVAVHRRNGYLSPAARALLELLTAEGEATSRATVSGSNRPAGRCRRINSMLGSFRRVCASRPVTPAEDTHGLHSSQGAHAHLSRLRSARRLEPRIADLRRLQLSGVGIEVGTDGRVGRQHGRVLTVTRQFEAIRRAETR